MNLVLDFDPLNNILRLTVKGPLTGANLCYGYETVSRYVASHPPSSGIIDLSGGHGGRSVHRRSEAIGNVTPPPSRLDADGSLSLSSHTFTD
jgi:hypothetical protein